jgi:hypothetical protein
MSCVFTSFVIFWRTRPTSAALPQLVTSTSSAAGKQVGTFQQSILHFSSPVHPPSASRKTLSTRHPLCCPRRSVNFVPLPSDLIKAYPGLEAYATSLKFLQISQGPSHSRRQRLSRDMCMPRGTTECRPVTSAHHNKTHPAPRQPLATTTKAKHA